MVAPSVNLAEVQGLVYNGYKKHAFAGYLFAQLDPSHVTAAQTWLRGLDVTPAVRALSTVHAVKLHVGFGPGGLRALGVAEAVIERMPQELVQGMAARRRVLGDDPDEWTLGRDGRLDVVLDDLRDRRRRARCRDGGSPGAAPRDRRDRICRRARGAVRRSRAFRLHGRIIAAVRARAS